MIVQGYMLALKGYGIESSKEEIYRLLKEHSSAAIAGKFQVDFTELSNRAKSHEENSTYLPKSFPGTKEVLQAVARKQKRNIILTHRRQDSTQLLLEREQLDDLISEIVGPENKFPRKPDPAALQYLLDKYSLNPKKTVMIGDRALDVDAGKNAGVHTLFFDNENLLHNIQADHRVTTMQEIERFV